MSQLLYANLPIPTQSGTEIITTDKIDALTSALLEMPPANVITTHTFAPSVYERKITIPPWTVLTGAPHKTDYKVRLEKGKIAVNLEDGTVRILTAPCELNVKAGAQRAGRVFEDEVVWVDVYDNPDDCQDLDVLEERLYVVPECGLADSRNRQLITDSRKDFDLFLSELGMSQPEMDAIVHISVDLVPMPSEYFVTLKPSNLHGQGLFTTKVFRQGEMVAPMQLNHKRTPAGRFINHSFKNNVLPVKIEGNIYAIATRDIGEGEELLVNYRDSLKVNSELNLQRKS
jgi:hypothetical protein